MTAPDPHSFVICPRPIRAFLGVAVVVGMPVIFLVPILLYANTLPPRPPGGILNVQTLELLGIMALSSAGIGSLWAVDCFVWRRRQWQVTTEGIAVQSRSRVVRHISWAEIRCLHIRNFGITICARGRCEMLYFADPRDTDLLKQWHNRYGVAALLT